MTADEAVQTAAIRHELRRLHNGVTGDGAVVYWWQCWCGQDVSANYPTEAQARMAHSRHKDRKHES